MESRTVKNWILAAAVFGVMTGVGCDDDDSGGGSNTRGTTLDPAQDGITDFVDTINEANPQGGSSARFGERLAAAINALLEGVDVIIENPDDPEAGQLALTEGLESFTNQLLCAIEELYSPPGVPCDPDTITGMTDIPGADFQQSLLDLQELFAGGDPEFSPGPADFVRVSEFFDVFIDSFGSQFEDQPGARGLLELLEDLFDDSAALVEAYERNDDPTQTFGDLLEDLLQNLLTNVIPLEEQDPEAAEQIRDAIEEALAGLDG